MKFEFATAQRIIFGRGALAQLPDLVAALRPADAPRHGFHLLVVGGAESGRLLPLLAVLDQADLRYTLFQVTQEPTVEMVQAGVAVARTVNAAAVIGMGGGSVMDGAKAIAALASNPGQPLDYLEVIGQGLPLTTPALPVIAVPTTAGTGAEVTKNAVLASSAHQVKVSLRHNSMLPAVALVDPALTDDLPPGLTANTGLDALTQCLEPFVSHLATPLTDGFCREGMGRAARSLRRAVADGGDHAARDDMALASLCGGLALANAKLGAVHGLAGPLGGMFPLPHGVVCARLLPLVMDANVRALRQRQPDAAALARYGEVAQILNGDDRASIDEGVAWVQSLCRDLKTPGLAAYGVSPQAFPAIVAKAQAASSMKGNPIALTDDEVIGILAAAR